MDDKEEARAAVREFLTSRRARVTPADTGDGTKVFRHPLIGEITLPFENLHVDAVAGQVLTVFTPQPGSPEADAIRLLTSWNAGRSAQGAAS